jgi:hypothetical protein
MAALEVIVSVYILATTVLEVRELEKFYAPEVSGTMAV